MSRKDITDLPVSSLIQDRSTLLLWTTPQDMDYAIDVVMPAWGFRYKTDAFIWIKTRKDFDRAMKRAFKQWQKTGVMPDVLDLLFSMFITTKGYYTRKQAEICLLGTTKKILPRSSKGVKELIVAPRREHSRKPDEFYPRVEQLYSEGKIIDLFARESHGDRWDVWGDQTDRFKDGG
jgi:N6-adenosine-specific RNA methylase IME4